jgi:hypothetical protein
MSEHGQEKSPSLPEASAGDMEINRENTDNTAVNTETHQTEVRDQLSENQVLLLSPSDGGLPVSAFGKEPPR